MMNLWRLKDRSISIPAAVILMALLLGMDSGCRRKPTKEPNEAGKSAQSQDKDQVAVTVNGKVILNAQVDARVDEELESVADKFANLPPGYLEQRKKEMRTDMIEQMVIEQLLADEIQKSGIEVNDSDVDRKISEIAAKQQPPMPTDAFLAMVQSGGQPLDKFKAGVRQAVAYQCIFERQWAGKIDVNDQEVKDYYDNNPEDFRNPEQVRASHILIKTESGPGQDPNQAKAAARAKAEDLLKQVRGGTDFAELAKANSDCPSAANGGDLGYFPRGAMVEAFEKAAFAQQPGQVSDLVETQFGFHIIKTTDRKAAGTTSFDEAKAKILENRSTEKKQQVVHGYLLSLKEKAKIEYSGK